MFENTTHPEEVQKKLHTLPFTFGRFECIDLRTLGEILLLVGNLMDKCVNMLVIGVSEVILDRLPVVAHRYILCDLTLHGAA